MTSEKVRGVKVRQFNPHHERDTKREPWLDELKAAIKNLPPKINLSTEDINAHACSIFFKMAECNVVAESGVETGCQYTGFHNFSHDCGNAKATEELDKLGHLINKLEQHLYSMHGNSHRALMGAFLSPVGGLGHLVDRTEIPPLLLAEELKKLQAIIPSAKDGLKGQNVKKAGRPEKKRSTEFVSYLLELYINLTGKQPRLSRQPDTHKTEAGKPCGHAWRFLTSVFVALRLNINAEDQLRKFNIEKKR